MQYNNLFDKIFESKTKLRILRLLSGCNGTLKYSGYEIAKQLKISTSTATILLNNLVNENILKKEIAGNAHLFFYNLNNYIVETILTPMFSEEAKIIKTSAEYVITNIKTPIISLIVFGSVIRGEDKTESDFDICVICENEKLKHKIEKELLDLADNFYNKFGKSLAPYILTVQELRQKYREKAGVIKEIIKEGKLIKGDSLIKLLAKEIRNGSKKNKF